MREPMRYFLYPGFFLLCTCVAAPLRALDSMDELNFIKFPNAAADEGPADVDYRDFYSTSEKLHNHLTPSDESPMDVEYRDFYKTAE